MPQLNEIKASLYRIYHELQQKDNYVTSEKVKNDFLGISENIIQVFDKREAEGVYVVDASVTISNDYGYKTMAPELPYEGYTGDSRLTVQEGNPHPYLSYPSLALPIAAFVQIYRDK